MEAKSVWKSRTIWLNLILFAVAVIGLVLDMSTALAIPDRWSAYLVLAAAILNAGLRLITSSAIAGTPAAQQAADDWRRGP